MVGRLYVQDVSEGTIIQSVSTYLEKRRERGNHTKQGNILY